MDAPEVVDPGLQTERTALAWERTALQVAVVGALLLRVGVDTAAPLAVAGTVALAAGAGLLLVGMRRASRREAALRAGAALPGPAALLGVGSLAVTLSLVALAAAVTAVVAAARVSG